MTTADHPQTAQQAFETVSFPVEGMTCAACSNRIGRFLGKVEGVAEATVNLAADSATVRFDPAQATIADLAAAVDAGANTITAKGPYFIVFGPEHAATLARDNWTVQSIQNFLYENARVPESVISDGNRARYDNEGQFPENGYYRIAPTPDDIHVAVAGGPGKHSAWIPSFGGTAAISIRVKLEEILGG